MLLLWLFTCLTKGPIPYNYSHRSWQTCRVFQSLAHGHVSSSSHGDSVETSHCNDCCDDDYCNIGLCGIPKRGNPTGGDNNVVLKVHGLNLGQKFIFLLLMFAMLAMFAMCAYFKHFWKIINLWKSVVEKKSRIESSQFFDMLTKLRACYCLHCKCW